jgi:hypothetical protein
MKVTGTVKTKVYPNADGCDDKFKELCAAFRKTISMKADVTVDILKGSTVVGYIYMFPHPLSNKWPCSPFSPNLNTRPTTIT